MANEKHVRVLKQGREAWNSWIKQRYPRKGRIIPGDHLFDAIGKVDDPDLSDIDLRGRDLTGYDLRYTDLRRTNLRGAALDHTYLYKTRLADAILERASLTYVRGYYTDFTGAQCELANLHKSFLRRVRFINVDLERANLSEADLSRSNLSGANLYRTNLRGSTLNGVRMLHARMVETDLRRARMNGCAIYGAATWNLELEGAKQSNFVITPKKQPQIIVDNLEVGQFIFLLLRNHKIRDIIDTVTAKAVLILGRFSSERKSILDAVKGELRNRGYLPVLFDFDGPESRDLTETVSTLAHIARFVVVDITDPRSAPQELQRIIPALPSVPVLPLLQESTHEYGMFEHFKQYPWVLDTFFYRDKEHVVNNILKSIITPAEDAVRKRVKSKTIERDS